MRDWGSKKDAAREANPALQPVGHSVWYRGNLMSIILCGLPMSGKTTIGKKMAKELNWNFIDTDELIENAYSRKEEKKYSIH